MTPEYCKDYDVICKHLFSFTGTKIKYYMCYNEENFLKDKNCTGKEVARCELGSSFDRIDIPDWCKFLSPIERKLRARFWLCGQKS